MILILTSKDDATADYVTARLRPSAYVRLNSEDLPSALTIESTATGSAITFGRRRFEPTDFTGVWYRRPKAIRFKHRADPGARSHAAAEFTAALEGFLALIPEGRWINHPARNVLAGHKLEQVRRAAALGFKVPRTLITQDAKRLREFWELCGGDVIIKPLSTGYIERATPSEDSLIYTNRLRRSDLMRTTVIRRCPTLFQERIAKSADIRITVVDRNLQAIELTATDEGELRLDIRRNNMVDVKHRATTLPVAVVNQIHRLLAAYGLRFAAIDMIRDVRSNHVFLEVNPNGQWAWLDMAGASNSRDHLIAALQKS